MPQALIFGAGAIGALYAAILHSPEHAWNVSAVCRSTYDVVKEKGFLIESEKLGNREFKPTNVFKNCSEAGESGIKFDYIFVSTKALPQQEFSAEIAPAVTLGLTAIVLIQNGFDIETPYLNRFPENPIITAVTIASAVQKDKGVILHNRWHRITFGLVLPGKFPPTKNDALLEEGNKGQALINSLVKRLKESGVPDAEDYDPFKIQLVRWHKAGLNAAFNPTSALTGGCSNRQMTDDPILVKHCRGVMQEFFDAGEKIFGVPFPPEGMATIDAIIASTKRNTTDSKPSMWYDWSEKRPMEIEAILGNPIRHAEKVGTQLPRTETMYGLLLKADEIRNTK